MLFRHVGKMDPWARIALGLALIAGYFVTADDPHSWVYLAAGAVGLLSGAMGSCGVQALIGLTPCRAK